MARTCLKHIRLRPSILTIWPNDLAAIVRARLLEIVGQKALDKAKEETEADKRVLETALKGLIGI